MDTTNETGSDREMAEQSSAISFVEPRGIEPLTSCLQSRRSTN